MFYSPAGCAACERRFNLSLVGSRPSASLWMYNARQQSRLWSLSKSNDTPGQRSEKRHSSNEASENDIVHAAGLWH